MKQLKFKLSIVIFAISSIVNAQDVIVKNDSTKLSTKIIEVNITGIKYRLFNYSEGPLFMLNKTDIAYITYSNGITERFTAKTETDYSNVINKYLPGLTPEEKNKKCEKLYLKKNYIGFNYVTFLNNSVGFNYMRDVVKGNLILNVPFAIGFASPIITNGLYGSTYLRNTDKFTYDKLNYQLGITAYFVPNFKREVNFLIGPSFNYTSYNVSTQLNYITIDANQIKKENMFTNTFKLYRKNYGISTGLLARFNPRINMNIAVTLGYRIDTYNKTDAFGVEFVTTQPGSTFRKNNGTESVFYANFLWSFGYRF